MKMSLLAKTERQLFSQNQLPKFSKTQNITLTIMQNNDGLTFTQ
jgi:hypothetical protein